MILFDDFKIVLDGSNPRKLFKMICDKCGLDRGYQRKHRHGHGLCRKCIPTLVRKDKAHTDISKAKMKINSWARNGGIHPMLGKTHSLESKAKISQAAANQNKAYKGKFEYKGHHMKSSWEVKYAQYLDLQGISWIYEPKFELSNGYVYLPDFQLSTGDIIEIKGYMWKDAQIKWDIFCADYPSINKSLLKKDDLKKLGII